MMNLFVPAFVRWRFFVLLIFIGVFIGIAVLIYKSIKVEKNYPTTLTGVHHLGSDYYINRFYINKSISDNVGEGGGGGSRVCCLNLPKKWYPGLTADVRWEVIHILRAPTRNAQEKAEVEGIYRAQVPIEPYKDSGSFYVHFFPGKRVRIVVSGISPSGQQHPIQWGDIHARDKATLGYPIESMFTVEESDENQRVIDRDRERYGGWR